MAYDLTLRIAAMLLDGSYAALRASWDLWNAGIDPADSGGDLPPPTFKSSGDFRSRGAQDGEKFLTYVTNHSPVRPTHRGISMSPAMYNLLKAKEEIDTVAKHTTDLAVHVLGITEGIEQKLESFKKEILSAIDARFNELERTLVGGEQRDVETSAISDLGAKMSQLLHGGGTTSVAAGGHPDDHTHSAEHHSYSDDYRQSNDHENHQGHDHHG